MGGRWSTCYRTEWRWWRYDNRGNIQYAKNQYDYYNNMITNTDNQIAAELQKIATVYRDIAAVQEILNSIRGVNNDERSQKIKENLKKYLNKSIKSFLRSYDPTYISNNNKIYLQVTSWNQATKSIHTFDNESFQYTKPPPDFYDLPETDTSYKQILTVEENVVDDVFYEPEGGVQIVEKYISDIVLLFGVGQNLLLNIKNPGVYTAKEYGLDVQDKIIGALSIYPGYKVSLVGAGGVVQHYDNPSTATIAKFIELDKSFIMSEVDDITEENRYDYIVSKVTVEKV